MKVCLVNPGCPKAFPSVPHGLLQLHAELRRAGHEPSIVDFNNSRTKTTYDELNNFDVVGLSVMTPQLPHALEIVNSLKPHVKVVWGGVHCFLDPLSVVKKFPHHYAIAGDGEIPFVTLLDFFAGKLSKESLLTQKGICFFEKEPVINPPFFVKNLDELADLNYFDLPELESYVNQWNFFFQQNIPTLQLLTSRGCHWECSFCINDVYRIHGAQYRSKSLAKIRRESEEILKKFEIKIVEPQDEDFFFDRKFLDQWKDFAKEKGFLWSTSCRFNYFNEKMVNEKRLRELVDHGLFAIGMSIEAGDETIRNKIICKKVEDVHIFKSVKTIRESVKERLSVGTSFLVYFPGDTFENRVRTIEWMDLLSHKLNIFFTGPQIYRKYPGSRISQICGEKETHREFDAYCKDIDSTATEKSSCGANERLYWDSLLPGYFNLRFRYQELMTDSHGRSHSKILKRKTRAIWPLKFMIYFPLVLPTLLRIHFKFWRFFYEPPVIGFFFRMFSTIKKRLRLFPD